MKKILIVLFAMALLCGGLTMAQALNHGLTLTWTASTSAATCLSTSTPACTGSYLIFEGPASGQESTTPLTTVSGLTYTDNGATMNAYLGSTRCYQVAFQEAVGTLTLVSANSNEACFSFPTIPSAPGAPTVTAH